MAERQIIYVTITYSNNSTNVRKMVAMDTKNAIMRAMRHTERKDVVRVSVSEPIPYSKAKRAEAAKRKKGQRERRKREAEEKIATYVGLERID